MLARHPQTTSDNRRRTPLLAVCLMAGSLGLFAWPAPPAWADTASAELAISDAPLSEEELEDARVSIGITVTLRKQDLDAAMDILRDYHPELAKRLEDWARRNPEEARKLISDKVPIIARLVRQRRDDPAGYRLAVEDMKFYRATLELSKQYRAAASTTSDADKAAAIANRLRELLVKHFDIRQQIREREIAKLEKRIEQLRKQLELRTAQRDKITQERLDMLLKGKDRPAW